MPSANLLDADGRRGPMAFAFTDKDKSAEVALRRIARERLGASLELLSAPPSQAASATTVHELRKNIKKTRALLRLMRPHFADFAAENAALRDAARILGPLREQAVLVATLDRLIAGSGMAPDRLAALAAALRHDQGPPPDAGLLLRDHADRIAGVRTRAAKWQLDADGFDALQPGLARSWDAARKAMRRARDHPDAEALHLWRKRVKDHWYHARLLEPIWPRMMTPHAAAADELGEWLGDARDSTILADALAALPHDPANLAAEVRALAEADAASRLDRTRTEGARLLAEPGDSLARRWKGWWRVWRA